MLCSASTLSVNWALTVEDQWALGLVPSDCVPNQSGGGFEHVLVEVGISAL